MKAHEDRLSLQALKEIISYDRASGEFKWIKHRSGVSRTWKPGNIMTNGYARIHILGASYLAHRIAWFYETGLWPKEDIDHENGIRSDNRFINLREATRSQNLCNAKCRRNGLKGVYLHKKKNKWHARNRVGGKTISLGYFNTEAEAHTAYINAAHLNYKQFARAK